MYGLHQEILARFDSVVLLKEGPILAQAIAEIFNAFKLKFVVYAIYCKGMDTARNKLLALCIQKKNLEKLLQVQYTWRPVA